MTRIPGRSFSRGIALVCSAVIAPGGFLIYGQGPPQTTATVVGREQAQPASPQQLDSLVAPIALYPDALLAQVLAASTYPLEIVTASRWMKENSQLKGKALVEAAGKQNWDPSVQALVVFPSALELLDQNLDWTTALGNMFLAQQADVMAAVQRMRVKAQQSGNLESNAQQQVQNTTVDGQSAVVIQPVDPQTMYVPNYDPAVVYGAAPEVAPYPAIAYPVQPPGAGIGFGLGMAVGALFNPMWGWGWGPMWGAGGGIFVNNNFFNHNQGYFPNRGNWGSEYRGNGNAGWRHNPRYRGGVPYPNRDVANRYNGGRGGLRPSQGSSNIGNVRPPGGGYVGGANRPGGGRPGQYPGYSGANRPGGGRPGAGAVAGQTPGSRGGAYGGAYRGAGAGRAPSYGNRMGMGGSAFRGGNVRGGGYRGGAGMRRGGGGYRGGGGFRRGGGYRGGGGMRRGGGYRGGGRRR
jgi:Protein of unknown function (DUF3300)